MTSGSLEVLARGMTAHWALIGWLMRGGDVSKSPGVQADCETLILRRIRDANRPVRAAVVLTLGESHQTAGFELGRPQASWSCDSFGPAGLDTLAMTGARPRPTCPFRVSFPLVSMGDATPGMTIAVTPSVME